MPAATTRKECPRLHFSGESTAIYRKTQDSMRFLNNDTRSSVHLDTPGSLDHNITSAGHTPLQKSIIGCSSVQQFNKSYGSADKVRAIVNIQITTDSVIRTHVSLYESERPNTSRNSISGQPISKPLSDEHTASFLSSSSFPTPSGDPYCTKDCLGASGKGNALGASTVRRILYSVDPSIYSDACEPLAHWIADHVWKVTTQGLSLPLAFVGSSPCGAFPAEPLPVLVESINSLLLSTLIQPSAIILSLFYIAHLPAFIGSAPFHSLSSVSAKRFNTLLLSSDSIAQEGPVIQALYSSFKLFVLGAILSNKILDDHVFTMKTWHDVSGIPLRVLNELEWLSLDILSHELLLNSATWSEWVHTLYNYHLSMRSPPESDILPMESYSVVRYMLEDLLIRDGPDVTVSNASNIHDPVFLGIQDRIANKLLDEKVQTEDLEGFEMDHDGPLREEYLPRRRPKEFLASASVVHGSQIIDQPLHFAPEGFGGNLLHCQGAKGPVSLTNAPTSYISTFPSSSFCSGPTCYTSAFGDDPYHPRVSSTLCDYFLSYSRVRVY